MADTRWNEDYHLNVPIPTGQNPLYTDLIKANITKINEEISKNLNI